MCCFSRGRNCFTQHLFSGASYEKDAHRTLYIPREASVHHISIPEPEGLPSPASPLRRERHCSTLFQSCHMKTLQTSHEDLCTQWTQHHSPGGVSTLLFSSFFSPIPPFEYHPHIELCICATLPIWDFGWLGGRSIEGERGREAHSSVCGTCRSTSVAPTTSGGKCVITSVWLKGAHTSQGLLSLH